MVKWQAIGKVHNINFLIPEHVASQVAIAILAAKELEPHLGVRLLTEYGADGWSSR